MGIQGVLRMNGIVGYVLGTIASGVLLSIVANLLTPVVGRKLSRWTNDFANARALRSKQKTQKRLNKLEKALIEADILASEMPHFTRVAWASVYRILYSLSGSLAFLFIGASFAVPNILRAIGVTNEVGLFVVSMIFQVPFFLALSAFFSVRSAMQDMQRSLPYYRQQLEASIAKLQTHLNASDAP